MPLDTETVDLASERERLREKMEAITDEQTDVAIEDETGVAADVVAQFQQRGTALERYRDILNGWVSEEWGVEEIEICGLTYGDNLFLEDLLEDNSGVKRTPAFVAIGTVDAPYLRHDPETFKRNPDAVLKTVSQINELPIPLVRWLEERIGEKSQLGEDMGNEYTDLLVGKLLDKTATLESNADG